MRYELNLNSRPFEAIKNGTKKIEGRVPTPDSNVQYNKMKKGDTIIFANKETNEKMEVLILGVKHYPNVREMIEKEGISRVLSSGGTIEEGIESYNKFKGYKENIPKHGIYAIEIKKI